MNLKKIFWVVLGSISLGVGVIGAFIPLLPSFPFLLLAVFSYSKSSERLHNWFINTKMYKNNLESHLSGKGMTKAAKIRVMCTVTVFMLFGFIMMIRKALYIPCAILGVVWLGHMIYFIWGVKTRVDDSEEE